MDATQELNELQNQTGTVGNSIPRDYYRKGKDGKFVKVEVPFSEHGAPGDGFFKIRITGISPVFPMDGQYGKSRNVSIEYTVNDPKSPDHKTRFSQMFAVQRWDKVLDQFTSAITAGTQLGKLIAAIRGIEVSEGEQISLTDIIGKDFMGLISKERKTSQTGEVYYRSRIVKDGFRSLADAGNAPETPVKEPEPVAAATPAPEPDSAFSDDLDDL